MDKEQVIQIKKKTEEFIKRLYEKWRPVFTYYYFNKYQVEQIELGFKNGLTEEQISIYADPEFNNFQMEQIRLGLEKNLSVHIYANKHFSDRQMEQIRWGLQDGLSTEQIQVYAKLDFNNEQMFAIRKGFEEGLSIEQVLLYAKPEFNWFLMDTIKRALIKNISQDKILFCLQTELNNDQKAELIDGLILGLSTEQILFYAKPELNYKQMRQIKNDLSEGLLSIEQITKYAKPELSVEQMQAIKNCILQGLPDNLIKLCINLGLLPQQIEQVMIGFQNGLSAEQISAYANPYVDSKKMSFIRDATTQHKLSVEQIKLCANSKFSIEQINQIVDGFIKGLTFKEVSFYANHEFNHKLMEKIKIYLKKKIPIEKIQFVLNTYKNSLTNLKLFEQLVLCFKDGLTEEQVKKLYGPNELDWEYIAYLRKCLHLTSDFDYVLKLTKHNKDNVEIAKNLLQLGVSKEEVEKYLKTFHINQLEEILLGYKNGLTKEQISVYTHEFFSSFCMQQIREGFEYGFSMEQVMLYANRNFEGTQMEQIKLGFKNGLSMEQVLVYAKPEFIFSQMREIRKCLMSGLSIEQVQQFAKPELDSDLMRLIGKILLKNINTSVEDIIEFYNTNKHNYELSYYSFPEDDKFINDYIEHLYKKKVSNVFSNLHGGNLNSKLSTKSFKI